LSKDQDTAVVIDILKSHFGFEAEKIPEQHVERADIHAWKGEDHYLFEVKSRDDHPGLMKINQKTQDLEIAEYSKELKRSNKISSILEKASTQLAETPKPNNEFSCVWFRAADHLIPDEIEFIKASLYGIRHLLISDSSGIFYHAKCYYYDYNDFYNFKNINAVVFDNGRSIHICINNHSDRIEEFSMSGLYSVFNKSNSIIDPDRFDEDSGILVADIECPRSQEDKVKEYLQNKYEIMINNVFEMKSIGGVVITTH